MVIFKNTLTTLLAEAEDDGGFGDPTAEDQNATNDTEGETESTEEETTEEDNKEEEQNDEDTEGQEDEEGGDDFSDSEGTDGDMGESEDGETEENAEEEAPSEDSNPYKIKTYFDRLRGIRAQYSSFENIVRNNKELDITLDDNQINTLNLIFDEIDKAQEQLDYLIVRGKILSLSADKVANVYNKLQSKLLHLIGLYEEIINKNL